MVAITSTFAIFASLFAPLHDAYSAAMQANPLLTKSLLCSSLFTASDVIAQMTEARVAPSAPLHPKRVVVPPTWRPSLARPPPPLPAAKTAVNRLDGWRSSRMALYAGAVDTPLSSWFVASAEAFAPGDSPQAVCIKAALGQVLWGPLIVAVFITTHTLLRGNGFSAISTALRRGWLGAVVASYRVWPLVYLINFALIPENQRVVFTAAVNLFWVAFLSMVSNKATAQAGDETNINPPAAASSAAAAA